MAENEGNQDQSPTNQGQGGNQHPPVADPKADKANVKQGEDQNSEQNKEENR
jgi:hypothetical protein